jgi:hypothetical protein
MAPWAISGWRIRYSAAVTISATPALLSAPRRVVPEAVTMSLPIWSLSAGISPGRRTIAVSSGNMMSSPRQS